MDDAEIDFSDPHIFADGNDFSGESFLDELLKSTHSCTHTHTCIPPGPDSTHTHTCFHTHTQLFAVADQVASTTSEENPSLNSPRCEPLGKRQASSNREAVRKYREKRKAQTSYLEEQVMELKALNQQLVKKLQGQAALETEVVILQSLLAEFRGRIDGELGSARPIQKLHLDSYTHQEQEIYKKDGVLPDAHCLNSCNIACDADVRCFQSPLGSQRGPSTPQAQSSLAGGSELLCEIRNRACHVRPKKLKVKEKN
eukprot:c23810_g1_i2 orf=377-1144(+)